LTPRHEIAGAGWKFTGRIVDALYAIFIEQNLHDGRNKPGWGALLPTWDEIGEIDGSTSPS
jgi:hypothetical protein